MASPSWRRRGIRLGRSDAARNAKATIDQRTVAAKEVLDRGYGKSAPPPQRKLGGAGSYDFSHLTPEQVRQGYEIARLMAPDSVGDTA